MQDLATYNLAYERISEDLGILIQQHKIAELLGDKIQKREIEQRTYELHYKAYQMALKAAKECHREAEKESDLTIKALLMTKEDAFLDYAYSGAEILNHLFFITEGIDPVEL